MNRFNLTFRGEIIDGHDPAQVKARLAQVLAIEDDALLQRCFSGDPVVLSRNLERKEAAELYARLRRLGIHAELVKISDRGDLHGAEKGPAATSTKAMSNGTQAQPAAGRIPEEQQRQATAGVVLPATTSGKPTKETRPEPAQQLNQPETIPAPTATVNANQAAQNKGQPTSRRADLAVGRALQKKEAAQLKAKEKELQKLLRAKEKEDAQRVQATDSARKKSAARKASHKAKLEASGEKAELAPQKRKQQAEAAARKAEKQRLEAQAKQQAEREQALARQAEKKAQQRAERERKAEQERERLAAKRAEQERRELARQEEKRRVAADKAALRAEEKRNAEEIANRLRVENARRKREQAEAAARQKAEEARKKAAEQAAEAEQLAQSRAMEEQAIQRAAVELAHKPSLAPVDARVKTRLDMPSMLRRSGEDAKRRKRQAGEPNLYSLTPFRNTPAIRARAQQSRRITHQAFSASITALGIALLLFAGQFGIPNSTRPAGAVAIAVAPQGQPVLLVGDHLLLHDRAGVSTSDLKLADLGLHTLRGPMAFTPAGELLAPGRLGAETKQASKPLDLIRCKLSESNCEIFSSSLAGTTVSALAVNPLDGVVFIADGATDQLLKVSPEGELLANAPADLPEQPALRLDAGLLLVNSDKGPAIDIYRYETDAFGTQLDQVLLLPPASETERFTGVRDFLRSGGHWWALLLRAGREQASLYRFDPRWAFIDAPALTAGSRPTHLVDWGSRMLVADPARLPIQRFNSEGAAEAPMISEALGALHGDRVRGENLMQLAWRAALALCLLAAAAGLCIGRLHRARSLVYTSCHEEGAAPVDEVTQSMEWVEPAPDRAMRLRRLGLAYTAIVALTLVVGIAFGISSLQLTALLLASAGPAIALLVLQRSDPGHIGVNRQQLLLVDHTGMYHLGSGSRIQYRGSFVMIDDVAVFIGTRLLPAFERSAIEQNVATVAASGVKVDRTIVTVKLLQGRHPLALGAVAIAATSAFAVALLSLQGIF